MLSLFRKKVATLVKLNASVSRIMAQSLKPIGRFLHATGGKTLNVGNKDDNIHKSEALKR